MPVRIHIGDTSDDPRVIDLQDYEDGRANFDLHYYYSISEAEFAGQVLDTPWSALQDAVNLYMAQASVPENEVALRFVHCFDMEMHKLYTRLQILQMVPSSTPPPPDASMVYDLVDTGALWYKIDNGEMSSTDDHSLEGHEYLENFYYKDEPQSAIMECLITGPTKYVKNLVFPWQQEVQQMYLDNGSPENAGVHFASCSYIEPPAYSNVTWPHGMVIYLSDAGGTPMLDDNTYISIFHNKGADMGTLCPPNCNVYIAPNI